MKRGYIGVFQDGMSLVALLVDKGEEQDLVETMRPLVLLVVAFLVLISIYEAATHTSVSISIHATANVTK